MRTVITNITLLTPDVMLPDRALVIENHQISMIATEVPHAVDRVIDGHGLWAGPGLIDIHVHGGDGFDTMDATPDALNSMACFFAKHGVTSFFPTTITAPGEAIDAVIAAIEAFVPQSPGAQLPGVHLEGPYLNPARRGAQPEIHLRPAEKDEYNRWLASDAVRLVTVAPEQPGVIDFIHAGVLSGVRFALGHSTADYEQVLAAADAGLDQATHIFNGMDGLHHREPGTVGGILTDERIYAQVIADGIHLHPAVVKLVIQAKGVERTILISDAMRAAGMPDGTYDLGGQAISVSGGIARTASGSLAGSTLTMDTAVRNVIKFAGVSIPQALAMASRVPTQAMGIDQAKGKIEPGADADLILFDDDLNIHLTMVMGQVVYERGVS